MRDPIDPKAWRILIILYITALLILFVATVVIVRFVLYQISLGTL